MLGWPSRHHRQNGASSGSRCLPPSHGVLRFPSLDDEKPVLQPHRIVIGFELGLADDKGLQQQAFDSPRSVLEPEQPRPPSPLSPLSALGSLLTSHASGARAGMAINELTTNVNVTNNATGRDCGRCSVDKADLSARSKNNRSRAANDQRNGNRRERHPQRRRSLVLGSDDEYDSVDDKVETMESIFSAGSPTLHSSLCKESGTYFLSKCYRCRRKLVDGKDVYMYRGDQAFCSQECRYMQIVADERKYRSPDAISCISGASRGISSLARATQTAFA